MSLGKSKHKISDEEFKELSSDFSCWDFNIEVFPDLNGIWNSEFQNFNQSKSDLTETDFKTFISDFEKCIDLLDSESFTHTITTKNRNDFVLKRNNETLFIADKIHDLTSLSIELIKFLLAFHFRLHQTNPHLIIKELTEKQFLILSFEVDIEKKDNGNNMESILSDMYFDYYDHLPKVYLFYLEQLDEVKQFMNEIEPYHEITLKKAVIDRFEKIDKLLEKEGRINEDKCWIKFSNYHQKKSRINNLAAFISFLKNSSLHLSLKTESLSNLASFFSFRYKLCKDEQKSLVVALKSEKIKNNKYYIDQSSIFLDIIDEVKKQEKTYPTD